MVGRALLTIATRDSFRAGTSTEVRSLPFGAHEWAAGVVRAVAEVELESSAVACARPNWGAPASTVLVLADSVLKRESETETCRDH